MVQNEAARAIFASELVRVDPALPNAGIRVSGSPSLPDDFDLGAKAQQRFHGGAAKVVAQVSGEEEVAFAWRCGIGWREDFRIGALRQIADMRQPQFLQTLRKEGRGDEQVLISPRQRPCQQMRAGDQPQKVGNTGDRQVDGCAADMQCGRSRHRLRCDVIGQNKLGLVSQLLKLAF